MNNIDLKDTKKKLAIIFTIIVFVIAFFLELTYFSLRYYNFSLNEKRDFKEMTTQISSQMKINPNFFDIFIKEWIKFKPPMNDNFRKWKSWPEKWFRMTNFLVIDTAWKIVAQNFNQDIGIDLLNIMNENYNDDMQLKKWLFIKKIDISSLGNDYKDLIFLKKQWYSWVEYSQDLFFFFLVNIFFSLFFYYIWLFFVSKNLKPVEQTLVDMNDFIHNANHELKTPIAVMSSNLQLLKVTKVYEEDLIVNSIKEIVRIDELIQWLSSLANINSIWDSVELNIETEIKEIIEVFKNNIAERKINLKITTIKNVKIKANREYFYIMFSNLLRNAIKYNFDTWSISIILDKNKLIISNTWENISQNDIPYIFDRFYKGEKSRNSEWFGIGLSLVKKICDIYNWNITVKSEEKKEIVFEIRF